MLFAVRIIGILIEVMDPITCCALCKDRSLEDDHACVID